MPKLSKEEIEDLRFQAEMDEKNADPKSESDIAAGFRELNEDVPDKHDKSLRSIDVKTDLTEEQILAFTSIDFAIAGGALPIECQKITQVAKRLAKSKHGKGIQSMIDMANGLRNPEGSQSAGFFKKLLGGAPPSQ